MPKADITELCSTYDRLKQIKKSLENKYDAITEFLFPVVMDTTLTVSEDSVHSTPTVLDKTVFVDGIGFRALSLMASAIMGSMWPNGAKSVQIVPPYMFTKRNELTDEEKKFYEFMTDTTVVAMDNPRANLIATLREYMMQAGAYGTAGVGCFDGPDENTPVIYRSYCAKDLYVSSDYQGRVDEVFTRQYYTVKTLVGRFGYTNVSAEVRKKFDSKKSADKEQRVIVIHYIGPRMDYDPTKKNAVNMPIASVYFEHATKHLLKESGFTEMPIMVGRFERIVGSDYGMSPGLTALSDIAELNTHKELFVRCCEKIADPITNIYADSILNAEEYSDAPGAVNQIVLNGRIDVQKVIEQITFTGDLTPMTARMTELMQAVMDHFHIDKLLDLNNDTMMTATETISREKLRGEAINSIFNRQEVDIFNPLIEATVNRLFAQGAYGVVEGSPQHIQALSQGYEPRVIPERVAALIQRGADFFDIKYISPAARIMKADELQGMQRAFEFLNIILPLMPEVADEIGKPMVWPKTIELTGAPIELVESKEVVEQNRQQRQAIMQQQMEAEMGRNDSEIARNVGNAISSVSRQGG